MKPLIGLIVILGALALADLWFNHGQGIQALGIILRRLAHTRIIGS